MDQLLSVIQLNVMRALVTNMAAIGYSWDLFTDANGVIADDAISPFIDPSNMVALSSPQHLRPTRLQTVAAHQPWIDLWPFPQMRDNILRQGEDFDDTPLCLDMVESYCGPDGMSGLLVWGDPWDPNSWEATEAFAKKWGWIMTGCFDLFKSTNFWRAKRGEKKLFPV